MDRTMQTVYDIISRHTSDLSIKFHCNGGDYNALIIEFEDNYTMLSLKRCVSQLDMAFIPEILLSMEEQFYNK